VGRKYRVEYTANPLDRSPAFAPITTVLADTKQSEYRVPGGLADGMGAYRVVVTK
jgi:hypothetical protein